MRQVATLEEETNDAMPKRFWPTTSEVRCKQEPPSMRAAMTNE